MKIFTPILLLGTIVSMSYGMNSVEKVAKLLSRIQYNKIYGFHRGPVEVKSYLNLPPALIQQVLTSGNENCCTIYDLTGLERHYCVNIVEALQSIQPKKMDLQQ